MRYALSALCLALSLAACAAAPIEIVPQPVPVPVDITRLPLDPDRPERTSVGRLAWRGGVMLRSRDERFGGLSALSVSSDGGRFVALSDRGYRVEGRLTYAAGGMLDGVADISLQSLLGVNGRPLARGLDRDAESLARAGDDTIITFEHHHRLRRYPPSGAPSVVASPKTLASAPINGGIEALTALDDGRLLALTEEMPTETQGTVRGWFQTAGGWSGFAWKTDGGFKPTGAATLPDGRVLILERRFPPVGARFRVLDATTIRPGALLDGAEIGRLVDPMAVDNMEGVAVRTGPSGETLIYVVSDDNYNAAQRTLLLMFALVE